MGPVGRLRRLGLRHDPGGARAGAAAFRDRPGPPSRHRRNRRWVGRGEAPRIPAEGPHREADPHEGGKIRAGSQLGPPGRRCWAGSRGARGRGAKRAIMDEYRSGKEVKRKTKNEKKEKKDLIFGSWKKSPESSRLGKEVKRTRKQKIAPSQGPLLRSATMLILESLALQECNPNGEFIAMPREYAEHVFCRQVWIVSAFGCEK